MTEPQPIDLIHPTRPRVSKVAQNLKPSGIREFFDLVLGRDDIVSLGVGEPDFATPWVIREEAVHSINCGITSYTSNNGLLSLRRAISQYLAERFSVEANPEDEVLVTVGVSEAIDLVMRAILNPGDEVIVIEPCYVAYTPMVLMAGGVPKTLATSAENGFVPDWEALEAMITPRTRAILVNYPCNPTGMSFGIEDAERLARLAARNQILLISDEVYAELTYEGRHVSLASIPEAAEWTVLLSGFSKAFAMTGWRIGYAAGPAEIIEAMAKIHQYSILCAPIMSQRAAQIALIEGLAAIEEMVETYRQRRNYIHSGFAEIGIDMALPRGAFYAFPSIEKTGLSSMEFCKRLIEEERVAVVPGSAFGPSGEGYIRASYAAGYDKIDQALKGIERFVNRL